MIDALDEAKNGREIFALLQGLPDRYSVFITSRKERGLEKDLRNARVFIREMWKEDTIGDLRLLIEQEQDDLKASDSVQMQLLIQRLIDKSNGSFLWTNLMLEELSSSWFDDDNDRVLDSVPDGMQHLYSRIVRKMASNAQNAPLAKAILRFTITGIRPLSVAELRTAIRLDTGRSPNKLEQAIESICSPLIRVNSQCRVVVIHDTVRVRTFLIRTES